MSFLSEGRPKPNITPPVDRAVFADGYAAAGLENPELLEAGKEGVLKLLQRMKDVGVPATASFFAGIGRVSKRLVNDPALALRVTGQVLTGIKDNVLTFNSARESWREVAETKAAIKTYDELVHELLFDRRVYLDASDDRRHDARQKLQTTLASLRQINESLPKDEAAVQRQTIAAILAENRTRKAELRDAVVGTDEKLKEHAAVLATGIETSQSLLVRERQIAAVEKTLSPGMLYLGLATGGLGAGTASLVRLTAAAFKRKTTLERQQHAQHSKDEAERTEVSARSVIIDGARECFAAAGRGDVQAITRLLSYSVASGFMVDSAVFEGAGREAVGHAVSSVFVSEARADVALDGALANFAEGVQAAPAPEAALQDFLEGLNAPAGPELADVAPKLPEVDMLVGEQISLPETELGVALEHQAPSMPFPEIPDLPPGATPTVPEAANLVETAPEVDIVPTVEPAVPAAPAELEARLLDESAPETFPQVPTERGLFGAGEELGQNEPLIPQNEPAPDMAGVMREEPAAPHPDVLPEIDPTTPAPIENLVVMKGSSISETFHEAWKAGEIKGLPDDLRNKEFLNRMYNAIHELDNNERVMALMGVESGDLDVIPAGAEINFQPLIDYMNGRSVSEIETGLRAGGLAPVESPFPLERPVGLTATESAPTESIVPPERPGDLVPEIEAVPDAPLPDAAPDMAGPDYAALSEQPTAEAVFINAAVSPDETPRWASAVESTGVTAQVDAAPLPESIMTAAVGVELPAVAQEALGRMGEADQAEFADRLADNPNLTPDQITAMANLMAARVEAVNYFNESLGIEPGHGLDAVGHVKVTELQQMIATNQLPKFLAEHGVVNTTVAETIALMQECRLLQPGMNLNQALERAFVENNMRFNETGDELVVLKAGLFGPTERMVKLANQTQKYA